MSVAETCHPKLLAVIRRHAEFFSGRRQYLAKVSLPLPGAGALEKPLVFDDLDWERDFDEYVRINVGNGKVQARRRLELDLGDDSIPCYHPYFGISIHHAFYGGKVVFSHGTSYAAPVIAHAADWTRLTADMENPWMQKLARGMHYCRDNGDGVLLASYRGGNGPLDMASGVLGNALLTEFFDDPDSIHRLVDTCTRGTLATFALQQENCSEVLGGRVVPMGNVWVPGGMLGHISLDAACLTGPAIFEEFERPYLEKITAHSGGILVHTHMLGRRCFSAMCKTAGIRVFAPADDPNLPTCLDDLDGVLAATGDVPLMLSLPFARFGEALPKLRGRRAIFLLYAESADDARRQLDILDRTCPLER